MSICSVVFVSSVMALASNGGVDSVSADSASVVRARAAYKEPFTLTLGITSGYDLELVNPHGGVLRFGRGVTDWRYDFPANFAAPGDRAQIHVPNPSLGTWKLRIAVDRDMMVLTIDAFASGGCSARDFLAPAKPDYAQWWKLRLTRDAKRDTCWMKLTRWKREKIRH